jgi:hypothetical protein
MTVTPVSIRLALKMIAEKTCGLRPKVVPVRIGGNPRERVFFVTLPFEYKSEICTYLRHHLSIQHPTDARPLILSSDEASRLVEFMLEHDALPSQCRRMYRCVRSPRPLTRSARISRRRPGWC